MEPNSNVNKTESKTQYQIEYDSLTIVHLLLSSAIECLESAAEGVVNNNIRQRGEGLGAAIRVIGELHDSLDLETGGESAIFLRDIYLNMLCELPKVSLDNDIEKVRRSLRYLYELKKLWEERVLCIKNNDASMEKDESTHIPAEESVGRSYALAI